MRFLQRVGCATVGIEIRGIPPFAKSAKDGAPGDWLHARFMPRGSATPVDDFEESRMKFIDHKKPHRKSGGMGYPSIRGQDRVQSRTVTQDRVLHSFLCEGHPSSLGPLVRLGLFPIIPLLRLRILTPDSEMVSSRPP